MTAARVGGWRAAALEEEDQHDVTAARVGGWRAAKQQQHRNTRSLLVEIASSHRLRYVAMHSDQVHDDGCFKRSRWC